MLSTEEIKEYTKPRWAPYDHECPFDSHLHCILADIPPGYRSIVKHGAITFTSEGLVPSDKPVSITNTLTWFMEEMCAFLGEDTVREVGVSALWAYCWQYLLDNYEYTFSYAKGYYLNVRPVNYGKHRKSLVKLDHNGMRAVERKLNGRPIRISNLSEYMPESKPGTNGYHELGGAN